MQSDDSAQRGRQERDVMANGDTPIETATELGLQAKRRADGTDRLSPLDIESNIHTVQVAKKAIFSGWLFKT